VGSAADDGAFSAARLDAARREVETFAREHGATTVANVGPGRWRIDRLPTRFKIGIDFWTAELKPDGGIAFSDREWRPPPVTSD